MNDAVSAAHIRMVGLSKTFGRGDKAKMAVRDISLGVDAGEMIAVLGASGSGKSTLLRLINGLHIADETGEGLVEIQGQALQQGGCLAANARKLRQGMATIFQQFNLVLRLTVLTNVCIGALNRIPLWRSCLGLFPNAVKLSALEALNRVGIMDRAYQRARLLSGGQQQRVAIARAITQGANLILADEPIASLDPESARVVMELLTELNLTNRVTVIISLHQVAVALKYCRRIIALKDGSIVYDGTSAALSLDRLKNLYGSDSDLVF